MTKRKTQRASDAEARRAPSDYATLLRGAGLRKTASRVAVLQFLERATTPLSHGEVADEMAVFGLDRASVYRNLIDLADAHLISRADLGDHVWRFELRRPGNDHKVEHPHFLCVSCGGVECLPGGTVRLVSSRGVPRAIGARDVEVQVKGRCDTCSKA